jgi:phosphate transport system protein
MLRKKLDHEIEAIKISTGALEEMVEKAIRKSASALKDNNLDEAQFLFAFDQEINQLRYEIEGSVMVVIATQQPIAHDLRVLAAILSLATELERVGDYAKGLSTINIKSGGLSLPKVLAELHFMAEKASDMLHKAMEAFLQEDEEKARMIVREDKVIDSLYQKIYYDALDLVIEDPRNIERVNYVLWAAHNLERIGDRAINICERTVFITTGKLVELSDATTGL